MYYQTVQQMIKMLNNLANILDKAKQFSDDKKLDENNLLIARLAPDQYDFKQQIVVTCETARFTADYLAGNPIEPDNHEDKSFIDLKNRISRAIEYISKYNPDDFKGSKDIKISIPFVPGMFLYGEEALIEFALPNFYFHLVTAYSILRSNGINLGKQDFMGTLNFKPL